VVSVKKVVKISGFPEIGYTAKLGIGEGKDVFIKFGTGDALDCDAFVVEIESETEGEVTKQDVLQALRVWTREVSGVMLSELRRHCDEVVREMAQKKL
jgi:hypothetical protein